jgi:hypothetical protein
MLAKEWGQRGREQVFRRFGLRQPKSAQGRLISPRLVEKPCMLDKLEPEIFSSLCDQGAILDAWDSQAVISESFLQMSVFQLEGEERARSAFFHIADSFQLWSFLFGSRFEDEAKQYWLEGRDFAVIYRPAWGDWSTTGWTHTEELRIRRGDLLQD